MRMHVRRHMGLTPYVCSWGCGKRFVSNALKNAHELKTHMGAKRFGVNLKMILNLLRIQIIDL